MVPFVTDEYSNDMTKFHSGQRAKDLISHLNMAEISALAPIPLKEIDKAIEGT